MVASDPPQGGVVKVLEIEDSLCKLRWQILLTRPGRSRPLICSISDVDPRHETAMGGCPSGEPSVAFDGAEACVMGAGEVKVSRAVHNASRCWLVHPPTPASARSADGARWCANDIHELIDSSNGRPITAAMIGTSLSPAP